MPQSPSHPICPTCGHDFVKNKQAPGRLICRHCNMSFDEKLIMAFWHGTGYSQNVRSNENYPAARSSSLPQLGGKLREEALDDSYAIEDDYEYFFDPNADPYDPMTDDLDDIIEYEYDTFDDGLFNTDPLSQNSEPEKEDNKAYGPFAILSAVVGLGCLIVSLIPVVGLVSVIPAVLGMMVGRLSWTKLEPGSPAYAAAIFGTIACAIAIATAIIAVICGENIIGFLNTTFPDLFQTAKQ